MGKANILVVDDEALIAEDIAIKLRNLGYSVIGFSDNGEDAIEKSKLLNPDLVLMDIRLNGSMDGISAANIIKSMLNIPIVFITAYDDDQTLCRAKITEPYGYILKPFEERELHISVEVALYKHNSEKQREELILELQNTINEVKKLAGLLPICSWCKKVKIDEKYWQRVEEYISEHTGAQLTHSLCPDCEKMLKNQTKR